MQIVIKTLSAGTYDVECADRDLNELAKRITADGQTYPLFVFKGINPAVPMVINVNNIVSIRPKR